VAVNHPDQSPEEGNARAGEVCIYVMHAESRLAAIVEALRARGFAVEQAFARPAPDWIAERRPVAIVIDGTMSEAVESVRALREVRAAAALLVVGLAAPDESEIANAAAFFEAHVEPSAIVSAVEVLVRERAAASILAHPAEDETAAPSVPGAIASLMPVQVMSTSSLPPQPTSSQPPGFSSPPSSDGAWSRGPLAGPTAMSPDLERLLREAERRMLSEPGLGSDVPTPDEEVNAILPADVLAALDEPLEAEAPGPASHEPPSVPPGTSGTGQRSATALRSETGAHVQTSAGSRPDTGTRHQTSAGDDGRAVTTGSRQLTTGSHEVEEPEVGEEQEDHDDEDDDQEQVLTPVPPTPRTGKPSRASEPPAPTQARPVIDRDREKPTSAPPPPTIARPERELFGSSSALAPTPRPALRAQEQEDATPTPPPIAVAEVERRHSPVAPPDLPEVLSDAFDGLRVLATCIGARTSVSLCFEQGSVLRRAILKDGDFVTCASSAPDESLVAYLVGRGDLPREVGVRLGSRLPPFGRHAAAALIAHGHLGQDQLWPVLRAHAEWLLGRMTLTRSGTCAIEVEPPGRLRAEPAVFGGAAGAEVLIEVCLRVLQPEEAIARLGGARARLSDGPRKALLPECALSEADQMAIEDLSGRTVEEVLREAGGNEMAPVLAALAALGVLEVLASIGREGDGVGERAVDTLDAEAVRARVKARMELVIEGDYFQVLGVPRNATSYELKRAYLDLRRTYEPSRLLTAGTADLADDVKTVLEIIEEAWEALRDAGRRERYRAALEARPPA
jgi:hypothetical protein